MWLFYSYQIAGVGHLLTRILKWKQYIFNSLNHTDKISLFQNWCVALDFSISSSDDVQVIKAMMLA